MNVIATFIIDELIEHDASVHRTQILKLGLTQPSTQTVFSKFAGNGGLIDAKGSSHASLIAMGPHGMDQHVPFDTIQSLLQGHRACPFGCSGQRFRMAADDVVWKIL